MGLDNNSGLRRLDRAVYMDVCMRFGKITMLHEFTRKKQTMMIPHFLVLYADHISNYTAFPSMATFQGSCITLCACVVA